MTHGEYPQNFQHKFTRQGATKMQTSKQRTWIENVLTCKKRTEQPVYMLNNIALLDKDFAQIKMNLCVHTSSKETISLK